MKKIISSLVLSLILVLNLTITSEIFAGTINVGGACGVGAGCPVSATDEASLTGSCMDGLYCTLAPTATASFDPETPCACQKAFGSGLLKSIRGQAGLSDTTVPQLIGNVIRIILGVSGTVALIFVIWGGIKWMISKGETEAIKKARQLMTSGMIGIAIIAAAYAITDFVIKQISMAAGA